MKPIVKLIKALQLLAVVMLILLTSGATSYAREDEQNNTKEIVIVWDCSKSMENVDKSYLVLDFIKGLSAAAPRDYKIGIVAFNDEICASIPLGSSHTMIADELKSIKYAHYGDAGAGLEAAVSLFGSGQASRQIILISDGEILMDSDEKTEESLEAFQTSVALAKEKSISIDVLALGERIEDGYTVYLAAQETGGQLHELPDADGLSDYINKYLFDVWGINGSHIGKMNGTGGELTVTLPDCYMESAKIILLGRQQNENMLINCEANKINVLKGEKYTTIELLQPSSETAKIQMTADSAMEVDAYLFAEYDYTITTGHTYEPLTQTAEIWLTLTNPRGKNLFDGHLGSKGITIYLNGEAQDYRISDSRAYIEKVYTQDTDVSLEVAFDDTYGNYYGSAGAEEKITVPTAEPEAQADWFFWSVIAVFVTALILIFWTAGRKRKSVTKRKRVIDDSKSVPIERGTRTNEFYGKVVVYVIRNKEDIDYPPESINLFARCSREMITLEWILDACNLPLDLSGAERIVFKPGADKSLMIKNNGRASVLIGRELLVKGRSYPLYYHEKVTFIFDQEDTEIEVHYKDLKPNER